MLLAKGRSDNLPERRILPEAEDTACSAQWHLDASSNCDSEPLVKKPIFRKNHCPPRQPVLNQGHHLTQQRASRALFSPQPGGRLYADCE